jgi:hypothetical protein
MYKQTLITFIDILGFKELVASKSCEEMQQILRGFYFSSNSHEPASIFDTTVIQFSDTIVRMKLLRSDSNFANPSELAWELKYVANMHQTMLGLGYPLRGAITVGEAFWTDRQAFGPGFVRAYELESQFARFPRILVDPVVVDAFAQANEAEFENSEMFSRERTQRKMLIDVDGLQYLDCLSLALIIDYFENDEVTDYFRRMREVIARCLESHALQPSILEKYQWLANDYNRCVLRYKYYIDLEGASHTCLLIPMHSDA